MVRVAVSGTPRGYQFPKPDGNWLRDKHKRQILSISPEIELLEVPAHGVNVPSEIEVLLAEGGNRMHYPGELDREDYLKFFTPSLKWVQLCSTGFWDNITEEIVLGRVTLTNAPGLHTIPIAESVLAAMLDHAKNLRQRRTNQDNHQWKHLKNDELFRRTVLLIGLGSIGQRVAELCQAFGMHVIGTKRRAEPVANADQVFSVAELIQYLPHADYIVVAAPHTPATRNVLGEAEFRAMKPSAYLINVGRGEIINTAALVTALRERWIAGAYLDVFAQEPLPNDHALWDLENAFVVPHDSHSSPFIGDRIVGIFCDNLRRYISGQPLLYVCDPQRGY